MSCCGTRIRVKKIVIKQQLSQVPQQTKSQIRQDDIIQLPKDQRKLFRCPFSISEVIKPDYMIVATIDYSNLRGMKTVQVIGQMMREENLEKQQSLEIREQINNTLNVKGSKINHSKQDRVNEEQRQLTVIDELKGKKQPQKQDRQQSSKQLMMMVN